jgi:hypothetical protein
MQLGERFIAAKRRIVTKQASRRSQHQAREPDQDVAERGLVAADQPAAEEADDHPYEQRR